MTHYSANVIGHYRNYATNKTNNKISKNRKFTAKTEYLNLKAPSNNVKEQSDKTLTTQVYFFLTIQQMESFLNETRQQADKKKNSEAKLIN